MLTVQFAALGGLFVGADDILHQAVANHVFLRKAELRDAIDADDSDYAATVAEIKHAADDKFAQAVGAVDEEPAVDTAAVEVEPETTTNENLFAEGK